METVTTSIRMYKKTKLKLDLLSELTQKKKSELFEEAMSLLVQRYKELGYNIPDNITEDSIRSINKIAQEFNRNKEENYLFFVDKKAIDKLKLEIGIWLGYIYNREKAPPLDYKSFWNAINRWSLRAGLHELPGIIYDLEEALYFFKTLQDNVRKEIKNYENNVKSDIAWIKYKMQKAKGEELKKLQEKLKKYEEKYKRISDKAQRVWKEIHRIEGQYNFQELIYNLLKALHEDILRFIAEAKSIIKAYQEVNSKIVEILWEEQCITQNT